MDKSSSLKQRTPKFFSSRCNHFSMIKASVNIPKNNLTEKPKLQRKVQYEIKLRLVAMYASVKNQYLKLQYLKSPS